VSIGEDALTKPTGKNSPTPSSRTQAAMISNLLVGLVGDREVIRDQYRPLASWTGKCSARPPPDLNVFLSTRAESVFSTPKRLCRADLRSGHAGIEILLRAALSRGHSNQTADEDVEDGSDKMTTGIRYRT